jgi:hypothetical protein
MWNYKRITKNKVVKLEHRLAMEKYLGRKLKSTEHIHHIDGNQRNNNIKNLILLSNSQHYKLHHNKVAPKKTIKCTNCKKEFIRLSRKVKFALAHNKYGVFCSRQCIGYYTGRGIHPDKEKKIKRGLKLGYSGYKIGKMFGLNRGTVYNYLKKIKK